LKQILDPIEVSYENGVYNADFFTLNNIELHKVSLINTILFLACDIMYITTLSSIQGASLHNSPPALFISLIT